MLNYTLKPSQFTPSATVLVVDAPAGQLFALTNTHGDLQVGKDRKALKARVRELEAGGFIPCTGCHFCHPA